MQFDRYERIVEHYPTMWPLLVPGYMPILNTMLDIVRALSDRPQRILDLGCGPGTATIAVAPASHPEGQVTLVDGSSGMLAEAERLLGPHVHGVHAGDFTDPAIAADAMPPDTYDLVLISFALHHIEDSSKAAVLHQAAEALRPGGLLLLADEVAVDRPAGWDVIERVRARITKDHLQSGRISEAFWSIETSLPKKLHLPFAPARIDDITSWLAGGGLGVSCPVSILGSALFIGLKKG